MGPVRSFLLDKKKWLTKGLLLLLLAVFGIGGIVSGISKSSSDNDIIMRVGNVKISKADYDGLYKREVEYVKRVMGRDVEDSDIARLGLRANVLQELENQALFINFAADIGLKVGNAVINENIKQNPSFFGENESFDEKKFRDILRNNGFTEDSYIKRMQDAVVQNSLLSTISKQMLPVNYAVQGVYARRFQSRIVDIVKFDIRRASSKKNFADADISKYYAEHKNDYYSPEKRKVRYFMIGTDNITEPIKISDDDLLEAINNRLANETERRSFTQTIFSSKAEAQKFYNSLLKSDGTFSNMSGSIINATSRSDLPSDFASAVFDLAKNGDVTQPIQSLFGWHVIQLNKILMYGADDVREHVRSTLMEDKSNEALYYLIAGIEDERNNGASLDDIAKSRNLSIVGTGYFSVNPDTGEISGDFSKEAPVLVAYASTSREKGGVSEFLYDESSGKYIVFEVLDVKIRAPIPIKDVYEDIRKQLEQVVRARELHQKAQETMDHIEGDCHDKIEGAAIGSGGLYIADKRFFRPIVVAKLDMAVGNYPDELTRQIFSLKKIGDSTKVVTDSDGSAMFAVLKEIRPAPLEGNDYYVSSVQSEMVNSYRDSLYKGVIETLRERYKITRNADSLNQ